MRSSCGWCWTSRRSATASPRSRTLAPTSPFGAPAGGGRCCGGAHGGGRWSSAYPGQGLRQACMACDGGGPGEADFAFHHSSGNRASAKFRQFLARCCPNIGQVRPCSGGFPTARTSCGPWAWRRSLAAPAPLGRRSCLALAPVELRCRAARALLRRPSDAARNTIVNRPGCSDSASGPVTDMRTIVKEQARRSKGRCAISQGTRQESSALAFSRWATGRCHGTRTSSQCPPRRSELVGLASRDGMGSRSPSPSPFSSPPPLPHVASVPLSASQLPLHVPLSSLIPRWLLLLCLLFTCPSAAARAARWRTLAGPCAAVDRPSAPTHRVAGALAAPSNGATGVHAFPRRSRVRETTGRHWRWNPLLCSLGALGRCCPPPVGSAAAHAIVAAHGVAIKSWNRRRPSPQPMRFPQPMGLPQPKSLLDWGRSGVGREPFRGRLGVFIWAPPGWIHVDLGSMWARFGTNLARRPQPFCFASSTCASPPPHRSTHRRLRAHTRARACPPPPDQF